MKVPKPFVVIYNFSRSSYQINDINKKSGQPLLQHLHLRPNNILAVIQHRRDAFFDLRSDSLLLGSKVDDVHFCIPG